MWKRAWSVIRAATRRGQFEEARRLAEAAVELAGRTDALIDHGAACRSLARVCEAAGDAQGARSAHDRAVSLFERKGATALDTAKAELQAAQGEFLTVEAVQKAALGKGQAGPEQWLARLQRGGLAFVLLMMSLALYNDVARLLGLH